MQRSISSHFSPNEKSERCLQSDVSRKSSEDTSGSGGFGRSRLRRHHRVGLVDGRRLPVVGSPFGRRVGRVKHDQQAEGKQELAHALFPDPHPCGFRKLLERGWRLSDNFTLFPNSNSIFFGCLWLWIHLTKVFWMVPKWISMGSIGKWTYKVSNLVPDYFDLVTG